MARIYTRKGDEGRTGLYGKERVSKSSAIIEAIGEVDEANAAVGLARAEAAGEIEQLLTQIQEDLFSLGAALAGVPWDEAGARTEALERHIDQLEHDLEPLRNFILPGGTRLAALLHLARAICRRAERAIVRAKEQAPSPSLTALIAYMNRLSDTLFVLARTANRRSNVQDLVWRKPE
ncbi:MAG: ATP--cob(I)alamin adenosyltransferase [Fimbriimonadales bacterium]|nr:MAG: ATP--cob(I)alamin adenosyltransferase [Fimbriimonadales bacterium]